MLDHCAWFDYFGIVAIVFLIHGYSDFFEWVAELVYHYLCEAKFGC